MGRTIKTANQIILEEQQEFAGFYRALRRADQLVFDQLFALARQHVAAISMAAHALPFEAALLAMLLEVSKANKLTQQKVDELEQLVVELRRLLEEPPAPGNE